MQLPVGEESCVFSLGETTLEAPDVYNMKIISKSNFLEKSKPRTRKQNNVRALSDESLQEMKFQERTILTVTDDSPKEFQLHSKKTNHTQLPIQDSEAETIM